MGCEAVDAGLQIGYVLVPDQVVIDRELRAYELVGDDALADGEPHPAR